MGYCYTNSGKLVCDVCGTSGNVRKVKCPYGYCQATAACPECRKTKKEIFSAKHHAEYGCKANAEEFDRREQELKQLLTEGKCVRCSALRQGERVKVIFRGQENKRKAYFMTPETYHAIPYLINAIPSDYEKFGEIIEAQDTDIYSAN